MVEKLAIISVLTSLVTESVKKIFNELNINYSSNIIASVSSVILTIGIQIYTIVTTNGCISQIEVMNTLSLILLAFLSSTLGYDKVIQTIKQIKG